MLVKLDSFFQLFPITVFIKARLFYSFGIWPCHMTIVLPHCRNSDMPEFLFMGRFDRKPNPNPNTASLQKPVKMFISIREMRRLGLACCMASLHSEEKVPLLLKELLNAFVPGFFTEVYPTFRDQVVLRDVIVHARDPAV